MKLSRLPLAVEQRDRISWDEPRPFLLPMGRPHLSPPPGLLPT
jgi:hypothetical protein